MNEKSKLIKIIQKKDISEEDRKVIKSLLGSLSKSELIALLKNDFKNYFLPKPDLSLIPNDNIIENNENLDSCKVKINIEKQDNSISKIKDNDVLRERKFINHYFFTINGLKKVREVISLYFFEILIDNIKLKTKTFILNFKKNIDENNFNSFPDQLGQKDINILINMHKHSDFIKYYSDLLEIVRRLIISSKMYKIVGASLIINYIAQDLWDRQIHLFQSFLGFTHTITDIYDCLKSAFNNFFPERRRNFQNFTSIENIINRKIIGYRIKLYIIENIYNKKYRNGCLECFNKNYLINTDIWRLEALQFHHENEEKDFTYSSSNLCHLFEKYKGDPYFLDKLISQMESEEVIVKCTNHHNLLHKKYFHYFNYLINWKNIFFNTPELIHLLIRISIKSYLKTKNDSIEKNKVTRNSIIINLKRRYIINLLYKGICPICEEFNIMHHLPVFQYHHFDKNKKTIDAYDLYSNKLPCSEIVRILEREYGGYICGNCHTILEFTKDVNTLNRIYDNPEIVRKILNDYNRAFNKFKFIFFNDKLIEDPLKKTQKISDNINKYLLAIDNIITNENDANNKSIAKYLKLNNSTVRHTINHRWGVFNQFLNFYQISKNQLKSYYFTAYGKKAISLIKKFRNYYKQL